MKKAQNIDCYYSSNNRNRTLKSTTEPEGENVSGTFLHVHGMSHGELFVGHGFC